MPSVADWPRSAVFDVGVGLTTGSGGEERACGVIGTSRPDEVLVVGRGEGDDAAHRCHRVGHDGAVEQTDVDLYCCCRRTGGIDDVDPFVAWASPATVAVLGDGHCRIPDRGDRSAPASDVVAVDDRVDHQACAGPLALLAQPFDRWLRAVVGHGHEATDQDGVAVDRPRERRLLGELSTGRDLDDVIEACAWARPRDRRSRLST